MLPVPPVVTESVKLLHSNSPTDPDPALSRKTAAAITALLSDICNCARSAEQLVSIAPNLGHLTVTVHATVQPTQHALPATLRLWPVVAPDAPPPAAYEPRRKRHRLPEPAPSVPDLPVPFPVVAKCLRLVLDAAGYMRHKQRGAVLGFQSVRRQDLEFMLRRIFGKLQRRDTGRRLRYSDLTDAHRGRVMRACRIRSIADAQASAGRLGVEEDDIVGTTVDRDPSRCHKDLLFLTLCCMLVEEGDGNVAEHLLREDAAEGLGIEGCARFGTRCVGEQCAAISGQFGAAIGIAPAYDGWSRYVRRS